MHLSNKLKALLKSGLSVACALLAMLTAAVPNWIETTTGLDPDQGDGSVEWGIVVVFAVAAVVSGGLARIEWRKLRASRADRAAASAVAGSESRRSG